MQLLGRTVPLWVLLAVLTISASMVYATVQICKDIQISMEIAGVCDRIVLDTDRTTELSSVNSGTLHRGDTNKEFKDKINVRQISKKVFLEKR